MRIKEMAEKIVEDVILEMYERADVKIKYNPHAGVQAYESSEEDYTDLLIRIMDRLTDDVGDLLLERGIHEEFSRLNEGEPLDKTLMGKQEQVENRRERKIEELREENPALAHIYEFMDIDFKIEGFKYEVLDLIKVREDLVQGEVYEGYRWLDGYLDKGGVYKVIKIHEKEKVYVVEDEQKILYSVTGSMIDQEGTDNL